jgi:hypothetical protein
MGGGDGVLEFIKPGEGKERDMKPLVLTSSVSREHIARAH